MSERVKYIYIWAKKLVLFVANVLNHFWSMNKDFRNYRLLLRKLKSL